MVHTCTQCGAVHQEGALTCCFCDTRLASGEETHTSARVPSASAVGAISLDSHPPSYAAADWRAEVSQRLAAYRARRRRPSAPDLQAALPFSNGQGPSVLEPAREGVPFIPSRPPASLARSRPVKVERVEIAVSQPVLDFAGAEPPRTQTCAPLFPAAAFRDRLCAGLFDGALLLLAYAGFLALFRSCGGQFTFGKFGILVYVATLYLFYAQYFGLFTAFGLPTPGMLLRGLRVVSSDGSAPAPKQLGWRVFGYLVSAGTLFLGFVWVLWDEDRLTWQDRISQTYLTQAPARTTPASLSAPPPLLPGQGGLAPR